jgi:hypothetical protein
MALTNQSSASKIFLSVSEGKFKRKIADNQFEHYSSIEGKITKIEFQDDEYKGVTTRKAVLTIVDGDETYLLQLRTDSGYYRGLSFAIGNANIDQPVKLTANSKSIDGGKSQTTMFVNQNGHALKWTWTKDNPGDLPKLEQIKIKGQMTNDNSKQLEFLENYWQQLFTEEIPF